MFAGMGIAIFTAGTLSLAAPVHHPSTRGGHPAQSSDGAEADVQELQHSSNQYRKVFQDLNRLNPMSADYQPNAVPPGGAAVPGASALGGGAGGDALSGPAAQLQKLLSNPAVQGYLRFFNSPSFAQGAHVIAESPKRKTLFWVEGIWLLLMFFSRSWRLSKLATSNWGQVLWVNGTHFVLMWGGALIAIPWILFGEPYRQVLVGFLSALGG